MRLSLIRLGTYSILLAAAILAQRQRYFIPIHLPVADDEPYFPRRWDPEMDHHGGRSPTGLPGFADTMMSGSLVLSTAEERVRKEGLALDNFQIPIIDLRLLDRQLEWKVTWSAKSGPLKDGTTWIDVYVDDKTHASRLERRKLPNKALEPTTTAVTPRATLSIFEMKLPTPNPHLARVVPAVVVAHL